MSPDKGIKKGNGKENNQQTLSDSDKESQNKLEILKSKLWNFLKNIVKSITEIKIFGIEFKVDDGGKAIVSQENREVKQQEVESNEEHNASESEQVVLTDGKAVKKQFKPGDTFRECDGCPEMVVVPAGSFMMGSLVDEEGRDDDEGPRHKVTISKPFAVGKYEVTRGQYRVFVDASGYDAGTEWFDLVFEQNDEHPVVAVSWDDAQAYIRWLSAQSRHQYRLLSEAEWEYAARAGTSTRYHFGDTVSPGQANYSYDSRNFPEAGGTVEVSSYSANDFGLHDMHGNTLEWVADCWHKNYEGAPTDGSVWVSNCDKDSRVLRGGSWIDDPENLRSANRIWIISRSVRIFFLSFRVARTLEP